MNQKPKAQNLLDLATPEELEKIQAHQSSTGSVPVDDYWMLLAEFGKAYGWEAYKDARDDKITLEEMMTLIEASRKLEHLQQYKDTLAVFYGSGSVQSKSPGTTFDKLTRQFIKQAKADE